MTQADIDEMLTTASRVELRVFDAAGVEDVSLVLRGQAIAEVRRYLALLRPAARTWLSECKDILTEGEPT